MDEDLNMVSTCMGLGMKSLGDGKGEKGQEGNVSFWFHHFISQHSDSGGAGLHFQTSVYCLYLMLHIPKAVGGPRLD